MADCVTLNHSLRLQTSKTGELDGGIILRHITRNTTVPEIIANGLNKQIAWTDVFQCIVKTMETDGLPIKLDIVDTVFFDRLEVKNYCYSDVFGTLMLQSKDMHSLESVYTQFMKIADRVQGNNPKNLAIYYKFGTSKADLVDAETFEALCFQTITAPIWGTEISIMQPLIPSRGYDSSFRTFRTTYWLDDLASTPQMKTETSLTTAISRSVRIKSQINRNPHENHIMETMVLKVILIVEKQCHCRVTHVAFDFVQDVHDKIWLLCSTACKIVTSSEAPTKSSHEVKSAQELKNKRAVQLTDLQRIAKDELEDRKELERSAAKAMRGNPPVRSCTPIKRTLVLPLIDYSLLLLTPSSLLSYSSSYFYRYCRYYH